jgi:regulator of sirC expression with transglutaminase-like and TPR domain
LGTHLRRRPRLEAFAFAPAQGCAFTPRMDDANPPSERFQALAAKLRANAAVGLAEGALTLAAEFAHVEPAKALAELDRLGDAARKKLPDGAPAPRLEALLRFLQRDCGYYGNRSEYGDPRNSDLSQVIARRTGIPITLAVVAIEVGLRCGVPLQGVPFPSHFLVRTPEEPPALGDPFHFRLVSDVEAAERLEQSLGPEARLEPVFLRPANARQTLVRMCSNLKHIHVGKQEWLRAIGLCDRILLLAPEIATEHRDRGVLYARLECFGPALADFEKYVELEPGAEDAEAVRENIAQLRPMVRSIN